LLALSRGIDAINSWLGRGLGWPILAMVMVSAIDAPRLPSCFLLQPSDE